MSNSSTPRHAHAGIRRGQAGGLGRALLPVALGGAMAGSVWLAAGAAAEPAANHPGDSPDGTYRAVDYGHDAGSSGWGGSFAAWRDGDGRSSYGRPDTAGGPGRDYAGRHDAPRQDPPRRERADHPHRQTRPDGHRYAGQPQVTLTRTATSPHRASSVQPTVRAPGNSPAASPASNAVAAAATPARRAAPGQDVAHQDAPVPAGRATGHAVTTVPRTATTRRLSSAAHRDLAAVGAPHEATDYVTIYGAIGGAALAALLGMGGVALWRRRGATG